MALRFDKLCLNSVGYVQVDHCGVAADYYAYLFRTLPRCWFWPGARLRYCKDYRAIELKANAFSSVGGSNKTKLKSLASCLWNIMPCLYVCMSISLPCYVCLPARLSVCLYVLRFAWCGCWFSLCFIVCKFIYSYRFVADFLRQLLLLLLRCHAAASVTSSFCVYRK